MEKEYKGLKENLERFKNDFSDEKTRLLFSIGYKQGYDQALTLTVVSSADYKHIWKLMDELNTIMWESYMIKGKDFGRQEGYKIMGLLEQWAERH